MDQEKIGKYISECRKKQKLTQEQLAEKLGVTNKSISRWENGKNMPDLSLFVPLSEILNTSVNELMSGEKIKEEEYQSKFEKNVLTSISNVNKKNKSFYIVIIALFLLITLIFSANVLLSKINYVLPFNEKTMYIENKDYGLRFINSNSCTVYNGNIKYISKSFKLDDEKIGLVFINAKCSISESYNYFKNNTGESMRATKILLPKNNFPKKIKIYYTEENLSLFNKANDEKIKEIIDNSHLLYEMDNNK